MPTLKSECREAQKLMNEIELVLKNASFTKNYRGKNNTKIFNFKSGVLGATIKTFGMLGYHKQRHNIWESKGVSITPVEEQKTKEMWEKELWKLCRELLNIIDPEYAEGEYCVQYACIDDAKKHHVGKHVDQYNISHQYALALGDYSGCSLRVYDKQDNVIGDYDYYRKMLKLDGRLPHELVMNNFKGTRYSLIFFKNYDRLRPVEDPIMEEPPYYV